MDHLDFFFISTFCLLGGVRFSSGGKNTCPCPEIPRRPQTEPPPETCFETNTRFRYSCVQGYVRKAGTSNLIICSQVNGVLQWTDASLQCIPDPKIPPQPRSTSGSPSSHSYFESRGSESPPVRGGDDPSSSPQPESTVSVSPNEQRHSDISQDFLFTTTVRISSSVPANRDVVTPATQRETTESHSVSQADWKNSTSTGSTNNCPCPAIPPKPLTEPLGRASNRTCFQKGGRFRYTCVEGYLRKAGTSDLIICKEISGVLQWQSNLELQCIPDPNLPQPTSRNNCSCPEIPSSTTDWKNSTPTGSTKGQTSTSQNAPGGTSQSSNSKASSNTATVACVTILVIVGITGGLIFVYQRRRRNVPQQSTGEETAQLHHPPAEVSSKDPHVFPGPPGSAGEVRMETMALQV